MRNQRTMTRRLVGGVIAAGLALTALTAVVAPTAASAKPTDFVDHYVKLHAIVGPGFVNSRDPLNGSIKAKFRLIYRTYSNGAVLPVISRIRQKANKDPLAGGWPAGSDKVVYKVTVLDDSVVYGGTVDRWTIVHDDVYGTWVADLNPGGHRRAAYNHPIVCVTVKLVLRSARDTTSDMGCASLNNPDG